MRFARLALLLAALAGCLVGASAAATPAPRGLHGFLFTADEARTTVFHRTPSFAWTPVSGAQQYELQLSTSAQFRENGIIYDNRRLLTPVAAPALTLPWITGSPHSLYARVRALFDGGKASAWGSPFGFDVVPPAAPKKLPGKPGLLRWTPVEGADGYQVWLLDAGKVESAKNNALDEREYYAFHNSQAWIGTVRWRVRAMRNDVLGQLNGIPVAKYGPWSAVFRSTNPPLVAKPIRLLGTISTTFSAGSRVSAAHRLVPGFVWTGDETLGGTPAQFFRVYVFTDRECVNRVYTSAVVGSPAYSPRLGGPLQMPALADQLAVAPSVYLGDGAEANDLMMDHEPVIPNEQLPPAVPTTSLGGSGSSGVTVIGDPGAPIDLWDVDWPASGYYWTVVPVNVVVDPVTGTVYYVDEEVPQDVCAAGRVQRFGISSQPSLTARQQPFASGLSSKGRLVSASQTHAFYGQPLVAWTPAVGASAYEVQWSKKQYPFVGQRDPRTGQKGLITFSTSAVLPLRPGKWWYRVRGFDYNLPTGAQEMAWSKPTRLVVTAPKFRVTSVHKKKHRRFKIGAAR